MGRPITGDEPRNKSLHIRLSESELEMMRICSEKLKTTRANVIVEAVKKMYDELLKNN